MHQLVFIYLLNCIIILYKGINLIYYESCYEKKNSSHHFIYILFIYYTFHNYSLSRSKINKIIVIHIEIILFNICSNN